MLTPTRQVPETPHPLAVELNVPSCPTLLFTARHGRLLALLAAALIVVLTLWCAWGNALAIVIGLAVAAGVWFVLQCFTELIGLLLDTLMPR